MPGPSVEDLRAFAAELRARPPRAPDPGMDPAELLRVADHLDRQGWPLTADDVRHRAACEAGVGR